MFPEKRRDMILQIMNSERTVNVMDLAKKMNVSSETIRRDLETLRKENIIKKTYGMAIIVRDLYVPSIEDRSKKEQKEKMAIAEEAIKLIQNNDRCILLDAGSTTECVVRQMVILDTCKNMSIITNGINIIYACLKAGYKQLYMVGGELRPKTLSIVGPSAIRDIRNYNIDIGFIGTTGVNIDKGFSSSNIFEVEVKKTMVSTARKVVVMADHTKFEQYGLKSFCSFEEIDYLITSNLVESSILKSIEKKYKEKIKIVKMK